MYIKRPKIFNSAINTTADKMFNFFAQQARLSPVNIFIILYSNVSDKLKISPGANPISEIMS